MRTAALPVLLPALVLAYLLLPTTTAHALEKKIMGDVTVPQGQIREEVRTAWGDVTVEGVVEEDVSSGLGDIRVNGPVGGDVESGSGDVFINAPVGGKIKVGNGDLHLGNGARVHGNTSVGNGTVLTEPGAEVRNPHRTGMASDFDEDSLLGAFSHMIGWSLMTLGLAASALLLVVAVPGPLRASARCLEGAPGRSFLLGIASVPVVIVGSVLLAITGVGILLLLLAWPAYLALVLFGALVASYCVGRKVVLATGRYRAGDALAAMLGALLVSATALIPVLGGLVFVTLALLGAGAAISALLSRRPQSTLRPTYTSYEEYLKGRRDA